MRQSLRNVERWAGVVALLIAALSIIFGTITQFESRATVSCQTRINQEFLAILKTRSAIGNENTANINNLIKEVFSTKDPKVALADYQTYLTELAKIDAELKAATYPDIGDC